MGRRRRRRPMRRRRGERPAESRERLNGAVDRPAQRGPRRRTCRRSGVEFLASPPERASTRTGPDSATPSRIRHVQHPRHRSGPPAAPAPPSLRACRHPPVGERAKGAWITDSTGRRYLDGLSGLWNVNIGHGRRELADAARDQMATLAFHSAYAGGTNAPAIAPGRTAERDRLSVDQHVLLHQRRRRVDRDLVQDGAVLLEGARQARQGQGHLPATAPITG